MASAVKDAYAVAGTDRDQPRARGIKNTSGVTSISMGVNGATPTSYDPLIDAAAAVEDANETPTAQIFAPRTGKVLAKLKDTTGQPLAVPPYLQNIPRYTTKQVPVNLTQGTSNSPATSSQVIGGSC